MGIFPIPSTAFFILGLVQKALTAWCRVLRQKPFVAQGCARSLLHNSPWLCTTTNSTRPSSTGSWRCHSTALSRPSMCGSAAVARTSGAKHAPSLRYCTRANKRGSYHVSTQCCAVSSAKAPCHSALHPSTTPQDCKVPKPPNHLVPSPSFTPGLLPRSWHGLDQTCALLPVSCRATRPQSRLRICQNGTSTGPPPGRRPATTQKSFCTQR